ncbi:MAG: type III secretion system export apparatus subunit SctS [Betaproteobacteria bacterium]|jgi:type III secretion HrpO family protein
MQPEVITQLTTEAIVLVLKLSAPLVGVAALIGLAFGFLQALTQLQDQTTSTAVKLLAIFGLMALLAPWLGIETLMFAERLFGLVASVS